MQLHIRNRYPPSHTGGIWDIFNSFNLASGITAGVVALLVLLVGAGALIATPLAILSLSAVAVTFGVTGTISIQEALKHRGTNAFDKVNTIFSVDGATESKV
jgi:hypothetical protein